VWIVVFGLLALFWAPLTATTVVLLLIGAVMAPAVMLVVWNKAAPWSAITASGRSNS
jgi:hypothetical protein